MSARHLEGSVRQIPWLLVVALAALGCEDKVTEPAPTAPAQPSAAPALSPPPPASAAERAAAESAAEQSPPESIAAQHVLIAYRGAKRAPQDVKRSKADARKRADEVYAKATGDSDFSDLAREYSDDPGGKTNRGNLGKFTPEKMVPKFSEAAFKLKVGEISKPVETAFGFHIIKRNQ